MNEMVTKLLSMFPKVKVLDAKLLNRVFKIPLDVLLQILIQACRMPVTEEDEAQIEATKQEARRRIRRGKHHTFCYIRGASGRLHAGIQRTYHRAGDADTCAEEVAIGNLAIAEEPGCTAVTVHFMPIAEREDGGVTSIVSPCSTCATRLRIVEEQQGEPLGVIVYHKGEVIKVPAWLSVLFLYPAEHDHEK